MMLEGKEYEGQNSDFPWTEKGTRWLVNQYWRKVGRGPCNVSTLQSLQTAVDHVGIA